MSYEIDGVRLVDDVGNVYDIEEWLDLHGYVELPRDANGITDELREFVDGADGYELWCPRHKKELTAIADRIDAEHERVTMNVMNDALYYANEDDMAELGWICLPKDAHDECIRVGDMMDGYGKTIEVVELRIGRSGWVIVSRDGNAYADTFAFAHHKPPTVEDVLREMLEQAVGYSDAHTSVALNTIAEYALKLQLRGEGE